MRPLALARKDEPLCVLCLGAHADDIEIGAGGTILAWIEAGVRLDAHWCVLSAGGVRATEAEASAAAFLEKAARARLELASFEDGLFASQEPGIKAWLAAVRERVAPDVVLTHRRDDAHQDHRQLCRLTWNLFRDHLILEYEVPKWDGDLGRPNLYVPITSSILERKIDLLASSFASQRTKDWFDAETFRGLARLRGMECRAADRYAEGFVLRKATVL